MGRVASLLAWLLTLLSIAWPAAAEKRVALVIGNGAYAKVSKLPNPVNDAAAVEAMLKRGGFEKVVRATDLGAVQMRRALRDFSDDVRGADIAVVFYAGHGMEMNGSNYLIPVDAVLERDIDVEDETVSLDRVNQVLEQAKQLRLVMLDACRDNPFVRSMKRTLAGRSIGRGLARVDIVSSDTLVAYAAKAGSVAADGDGANSPYTTALAKHLITPGLDVRLALGRVRDEVLRATNNRQEPFVYGSLGGSEIALVAAKPAEGGNPSLPTGTRPLPFSEVTAGGLFTEKHASMLKSLAEKRRLAPLPDIKIDVPDVDVPFNLRRFVGVWSSAEGGGRSVLIITTSIRKDGRLDGYWLWGPPTPSSLFQYPAGIFRIAGTATDGSLRFNNPSGTGSYRLTLTNTNKMKYVLWSTKGDNDNKVLDPVWTLVGAERSIR